MQLGASSQYAEVQASRVLVDLEVLLSEAWIVGNMLSHGNACMWREEMGIDRIADFARQVQQ